MVQLKKKVTLKTKIADSDVKQDIQPKNTAPQEPVNKTGGGKTVSYTHLTLPTT